MADIYPPLRPILGGVLCYHIRMHGQSVSAPFFIPREKFVYGFFLTIVILTFLLAVPLYLYAQVNTSGPNDFSATIKSALLSDPRARSLSPDQLSALVYALMQQATAQGMTRHDILWRPVLAHTITLGEPAVADTCGIPAPLCALNRSLGFSGSDLTIPVSLGVLAAIILALLAGYLELQHRNRLRVEA